MIAKFRHPLRLFATFRSRLHCGVLGPKTGHLQAGSAMSAAELSRCDSGKLMKTVRKVTLVCEPDRQSDRRDGLLCGFKQFRRLLNALLRQIPMRWQSNA